MNDSQKLEPWLLLTVSIKLSAGDLMEAAGYLKALCHVNNADSWRRRDVIGEMKRAVAEAQAAIANFEAAADRKLLTREEFDAAAAPPLPAARGEGRGEGPGTLEATR